MTPKQSEVEAAEQTEEFTKLRESEDKRIAAKMERRKRIIDGILSCGVIGDVV